MYKGRAFSKILVALVLTIRCLACPPDLSKCASQDGYRSNFKNLIADNPNYFGNAPETNRPSVIPLSYDTQYEQLVSIGFNPILSVLEATIEIKLDYGFDGPLCTNGSFEYVRFYERYGPLWYQWTDLGAVAVNTHDVLGALDCSKASIFPLFYVLTLPFQPSTQNDCELPRLPEIRAILSWDQLPPPSSPYFPPTWGNALDQYIQSPTLPLPPPKVDFISRALSEENIRKELRIPKERFHYSPSNTDQQRVLSQASSSTTTLSELPRPGSPPNIIFEELIGLGLDYNLQRLVATIRIKEPEGYGTGNCGNGTLEYIAFWADWYNTCNWTYLGQATINVHNLLDIPPGGVAYSAVLPVDLRNVSHICNTTQISRVRAALSWDVPPPVPPQTARRGNWLQVHVQIPPNLNSSNLTAPEIFTIGGVPIEDIDVKLSGLTLADAAYAFFYKPNVSPLELLPVDIDWAYGKFRPCPFGGSIYITGPTVGTVPQPSGPNCNVGPSQYQYRVVYRPFGSTLEPHPVLNSITPAQIYLPGYSTIQPLNSQGYFYYLPLECNIFGMLSWWLPPTGGLYQIRLELATQTSPSGQTPITYKLEGATDWYNITVNDIGPSGTFVPTNEPVCGTFPAGTNLTGTLTADAPYFGSYYAGVYNSAIDIVIDGGTDINPGFTEIPSPVPWTWDSATAPPCGYVAALEVCDRTIYDSVPYDPGCIQVPPGGIGFCVGPALVM
jgi:hypothetical protein